MSTTFTDTDVNNCFSIYNTDTERLVISFNTTKNGWKLNLWDMLLSSTALRWIALVTHFPNIIKPLIGMHEKHYSLVWYIKIMNTAIIIIDSETIKADFWKYQN